MNIENLRRLINGAALNKPSVSAVEGFAFESKNVHQGYAYIGLGAGADEIAAAVANGAYAVLVEQRCEVIDPEVAFIKVDSLSAALMRLMRFEASYKNLKFCSVNPVQKALLARMSLGKNADGNAASLLPEDATRLFIKIMKFYPRSRRFTTPSLATWTRFARRAVRCLPLASFARAFIIQT